jgi:hypothetical protein
VRGLGALDLNTSEVDTKDGLNKGVARNVHATCLILFDSSVYQRMSCVQRRSSVVAQAIVSQLCAVSDSSSLPFLWLTIQREIFIYLLPKPEYET